MKIPAWLKWLVPSTKRDIERIITKVSELATALGGIETQLTKAKDEIVAEIQKLKDALSDVDVPAEAEASLTRLGTLAQALDDINPDTPTP